MIEAQLSVRIPELWVTPVTENHDVEIKCQVGGSRGEGGWGFTEIRGKDEDLDQVVEEIRNHPSVGAFEVKTRKEGLVGGVVDVVRCRACKILTDSKAFMVFPVAIKRGRMRWVIVTDDNPTLGKISDALRSYGCDVDITSVVRAEQKKLLTDRQEEVIETAFERGYFDYPKKIGSKGLADHFGISVSTISEIMRAAQRRILHQYVG